MLTSATRGEMLTPNPNECNSTLTSITGVLTPTMILTYIDVFWWYGILAVPAICVRKIPTFAQFHQPRSQGCIRTTLAQSSDSSILIGRQFFKPYV